MQIIKAPYYSLDNVFLFLSSFFERAGNYGMRSIVLVLDSDTRDTISKPKTLREEKDLLEK